MHRGELPLSVVEGFEKMKAAKNNYLLIPKGVEVSDTGLKITTKLSYRQWENLGSSLQAIHRSILWWAGDWLLWGERAFNEEFSQAIAEYSKQTLCNAMWVSRRIEFSRRSRKLSGQRHKKCGVRAGRTRQISARGDRQFLGSARAPRGGQGLQTDLSARTED